MIEWINVIVQGVLLGGLYALFATGLSLSFGVMRLINMAHGDFIILSAYLAFAVVQPLDINPLYMILLIVPLMAVFGYVLQRLVLNKTLGNDILAPLLVTFGMSIIVQNLLLEIFSADFRGLNAGAVEIASISLSNNIAIGVFPLITIITAIAVIVVLQYIFYRTKLGMCFRATSDDHITSQLMGIKTKHIYGMAMGLALGVTAIAGVLLAIRTNFDPAAGPLQLLYAFEVVIIGGLGSFWGTLVGGIILGVAQTIGSNIDPGWGILTGHIVFIIILMFKPNGLFPKTKGK
ncbi:branched-chain amino acid ABC transporter permease [uncultured Arcobacter sp.]|jgi:branched-chain amino acid transport system permease protein|uniref:branched-chain amino acid ABC transporter permease n=1 Tax=uncultured Arcobacter sp. TaxID=165434 RepID=UPI002639F558|nr:branched-chain amino acid ABC transporter permease [uncultured Arcobacter sp.]|tara:strand:- start:2452 stop:3324 length:873 start_codon:yes stop_codon:yes gene_type:complete